MKSEEFQEDQRRFEGELNEWIAKQGLVTQLRLGWTKSGSLGVIARLILVGFLLVIVGAVGGLIWVSNFLNGGAFKSQLQADVRELYEPETLFVGGGKREQGQFVIDRLRILETDKAFFRSLEARDLNLPMDFGQGIWRKWLIGAVEVNELDLDLHTHLDEDLETDQWFTGVFQKGRNFGFNSIRINRLKLTWEGQRDEGQITLRKAVAIRRDQGWELTAEEGVIDYLWMDRLELKDIRWSFTSESLEIKQMKVFGEQGSVLVAGQIVGGDDPSFDLALELKSLMIDKILPEPLRPALTGSISGTGQISGNLHAGALTTLNLEMKPENGDNLSVWSTVPFLDSLSFLDPSGRYARLPLSSGEAVVRLEKNRCVAESIDLESPEGIRLTGAFVCRPPNEEEIKDLLDRSQSLELESLGLVIGLGESKASIDEQVDAIDEEGVSEREKNYAKQLEELRDKALAEGNVSGEQLRKAADLLERTLDLRKRKVFEGKVNFGLPRVVINRQPVAAQLFERAGRHFWLEIPLAGEIESLGRTEGETVRELARERINFLRE